MIGIDLSRNIERDYEVSEIDDSFEVCMFSLEEHIYI